MKIILSYSIRYVVWWSVLRRIGRRGTAGRWLRVGRAMALVERTDEQEAVGDDGYRRIRSDIVFARLRPGQKLRLEGLKEDYGVSVSTLREILNRLAAEGFVLAEGRRGFEVAPVSP